MDWGDGTYERTAATLVSATRVVADGLEPVAGLRALDVGCGSGNAALELARRGAQVTALDPSPRLVEVARERAAAESLPLRVASGEAAALPFADGAFDVVVSVFAVIFAPEARAAARELVRVLGPKGRLRITAWAAEGPIFQAGQVLWRSAAPPGGAPPNERPAWGEVAFVRELFEPLGASVEASEHALSFEAESARAWFDDQEAHHPVWRGVRRLLADRPGAWDALRAESIDVLERGNELSAGFKVTSRYKVYAIARR